ncbi:heat shock protein HtpX [Deinococcus yavapaiensis KR-236]|uniref:Heat shock protein HtpX n=1 Tax=Deinococcus yavapaiensis KR-236 TaxID=694435 RepID=A0A318SP79_9DEIO|nr:heat shock protein HtpX [Deinococcus yavapaiensis KR-236]
MNAARARRLRDEFVRAATQARPGAVYWVSQGIALLALAGYVALAVWAARVVWRATHPFHFGLLFVGVIALALVWIARPRFTRAPETVLTKEQAPHLHALVEEIARAMKAPVPTYLTVDAGFNAFMGTVGVGRTSWMNLGLPILLSLEPQERVFVIAHELAHAVNNDPRRGLLFAQAQNFLMHAWWVLRPQELWPRESGLYGLIGAPINLALLVVSCVPWGLAWLLTQLSGEASQRAEYHADLLAASVSGSEAARAALDKLHVADLYDYALQRHRLQPARAHVFEEFRHQIREASEAYWQAAREKRAKEGASLDASHPPTSYRVDVIAAHPAPPAVTLDHLRASAIAVELTPLVAPLSKVAYDEYSERLVS